MNAIAYKFTCADCDAKFEAPEIPEMSYGLFVMRTKESNEAAFLEAINDPIFLESYEIVKNNPLVANRSPLEQGKIQQSIFMITCDKSAEKASFEIGLTPQCPVCGSRNMASWQPIVPTRDWPLPIVTHAFWKTKSLSEKVTAIDEAIRRMIR